MSHELKIGSLFVGRFAYHRQFLCLVVLMIGIWFVLLFHSPLLQFEPLIFSNASYVITKRIDVTEFLREVNDSASNHELRGQLLKYSNDGLTKSYRISFNEEEQRALENSTAARDLKRTAESVPYNLSKTDWDLMKKVETSSLPLASFCAWHEKTCFRYCDTFMVDI